MHLISVDDDFQKRGMKLQKTWKDLIYKSDEPCPVIHNEAGLMPYLHYPALDQTGIVKNLFTTRLGGVSKGIWESMNVSWSRGDEPEAVRENFRRAAEAMGITPDDIVCTQQTHTTNVRTVHACDKGKGVTKPLDYQDVDGLITNEKGICLAAFFADCVPLFFVDPVHHAIGLSHSGWRGTAAQMGAVTLNRMNEEFQTKPADTIAAVGPSICRDCYEVSEDVIDVFRTSYEERYWPELYKEKPGGKYQLDLWRACVITLLKAGIREENLSVANLCTCCNGELLFSHRASKGERGNLGAFLCLI